MNPRRLSALAHLLALAACASADDHEPPREVDAEALGKILHRHIHPGDAELADREWHLLFDDDRKRWTAQAISIHAIGYAAGRSEGEAERARLFAVEVNLRDSCRIFQINIDERDGEIARLTAELADVREAHAEEIDTWRTAAGLGTAEELSAALDRDRRRFHSELDAARAEGARE